METIKNTVLYELRLFWNFLYGAWLSSDGRVPRDRERK
jgi:hypothetical protein